MKSRNQYAKGVAGENWILKTQERIAVSENGAIVEAELFNAGQWYGNNDAAKSNRASEKKSGSVFCFFLFSSSF